MPFVAAAAYFFFVYLWVSDEITRDRRVSHSAATAIAVGFLLLTTLVVLASLGGVLGIPLPRVPSIVAGSLLSSAGVFILTASVRALGSRERLLGMAVPMLVSTGPYRYSRHPFYLGYVLALLGCALAGRSALALGSVALTAVALARISRGEERWLSEALGLDYEQYRQRARALIGRRHRLPAV